VFAIPGTRHEFEVIRLWEVPPEALLPFPGLLPFAILGRTEDKTQTLKAIAKQIETLPEREERSNVAAATSVLSGLVLEKAIIQQILREDIMKDSVIYQDILEQGLQKGVQQGIQQGQQQGKAALVLRQLQRRFGLVGNELEAHIRALSVEQLEALGEALLDFSELNDLVLWLNRYCP
jgi:predicted transposase YdaD